MMGSIPKKYFEKVLEDLEYVKNFKSHSILFTTNNTAVGLGEAGSYIRIEGQIPKKTFLYDMIIETRTIAAVLKAASAEKISEFIVNPLMLNDPSGLVSIATGLAPLYVESMVNKTLEWCTPWRQLYEEEITDSEEIKALKVLKSEEGNVLFKRIVNEDQYIIPLNKKFLPIVLGDKISIRIFDESNKTFYVCLVNNTKKGYTFYTFMRCLRV